jgi:hypothetical protein
MRGRSGRKPPDIDVKRQFSSCVLYCPLSRETTARQRPPHSCPLRYQLNTR